MRILSITLTLFFFACQESQFLDLGKDAIKDDSSIDLDASAALDKSAKESSASEPIMIGGAFLNCEPLDSLDMLDYQANCRLEAEGEKIALPSSASESFKAVLVSETVEILAFVPLEKSSPWQWTIYIPKDFDFALIRLVIAELNQKVIFDLPFSPELFEVPTENDLESGPDAPENTVNDAPPLTLLNYQLGVPPSTGFYLVGNNNMQQSANPDCSLSILAAASGPNIPASRSFQFEIPAGGATLSIEIPKMCGVGIESGQLDYNRVNIRHSNGFEGTIFIPGRASSLAIADNLAISAGVLTITIESRLIADSYFQLDTFAFWPIEVISDRPLFILP